MEGAKFLMLKALVQDEGAMHFYDLELGNINVGMLVLSLILVL